MEQPRRPAIETAAMPARFKLEICLPEDRGEAMARDVRLGLSMQPKELPPKYFYDDRGSRLF